MIETALADQLRLLPEYLGHHLTLTLVALSSGIALCLPLAILVTRVKSLQWPVLTVASVAQTIPGLALLALMVPLLGQIGFLPAFIALLLYSMLPILRNTVTGILGVAPDVLEAAEGLGMTSGQRLFRVELPLAAPVIIAGIRTATVWVVGSATLSTPVGATSLGNYIFSGLQTQNSTAVLVGCAAAAALAMVLDQLIRLGELAVAGRSRTKGWLAVAGLLFILLATLILQIPTAKGSAAVVVGAKPYTEQYVLAEALTQRLTQAGLRAENLSSMGSMILFDALTAGHVDCYVDYSGTVWANVMKRQDLPPRADLLEQMKTWLQREHQVLVLGALGFENNYALAVPRLKAEALQLASVQDLSRHAPQMTIGSDLEFFVRPEWTALREAYRLDFREQRTFDPSLMYAAAREGVVDVISAYTTDGRIIDYDLVALADPLQALPPYDAVLVLSPAAARRGELVSALEGFVGSIDDGTMRAANKRVDVDGESPAQAARFLLEAIALPSLAPGGGGPDS